VAGQWVSLGTPVSTTHKTDCHNITEIKVCFCPQKRMSPPVPQAVVKGKKSI